MRKLSVRSEKTEQLAAAKNDFVESIDKSIKTPMAFIKYCYLCKPYFYAGSHVPRYSVTLLFDENLKDHKKFLENIEKIATKNEVETIGYRDNGLISIKFQTKDLPELFCLEKNKKKPEPIILEHDLPEGFKASVEFELNTYFNKGTKKKAFNFSPTKVIFHTDNEDLELTDTEASNDNNKSSRNRPRAKDSGIRDSKLQSPKKRSVGKQLRSGKDS